MQAQAHHFSPVNDNAPRERAAVRRVNIKNATATTPPMITVYFRDAEAARTGFQHLLPGLADDVRTQLDLSAPMPTLTYPVL